MKVYFSNMLMSMTSTQAFKHTCFAYIIIYSPLPDTKYTIKIVDIASIMIMLFKYCLCEPVKICILNEDWVDVILINILEK